MFFVCVVTSDLYLFQEIFLLNPKTFILRLIDKVTNKKIKLSVIGLTCCSICLYCCHVGNSRITIWITRHVINIIIRYYKCFLTIINQVLQLINDKSRNLQKLLKYFHGITTSVSNVSILFGMLSINFVLYSKSLKNCSALIYQIISIMILILIIIYSISTKIPQSSWCHRTIVTIS